eukprot:scaffold18191_cov68-Skeletonema_dohrnii-CCMP3373.AAC.1
MGEERSQKCCWRLLSCLSRRPFPPVVGVCIADNDVAFLDIADNDVACKKSKTDGDIKEHGKIDT